MNTTTGTEVVGNTRTTTKHRGYMLTINNPTEDDINTIKNDNYQYAMWQLERGDTLHIQAFIYYSNPRVWPKNKYPRAHIEVARNINDCINYCSKEDTRVEGPFETGIKPQQGARNDLRAIYDRIKEGASLDDILEEFPAEYIRFNRGIKDAYYRQSRFRTGKQTYIWIWGQAGVGKTRYIFDRHTDVYVKDGTQWWDGYEDNEVVLIDDFDAKWPFRDWLRLFDRYPYQGQNKGGYVRISDKTKFIYVTCEYPPHELWQDNELAQVQRRFDEIIHLT